MLDEEDNTQKFDRICNLIVHDNDYNYKGKAALLNFMLLFEDQMCGKHD
jgi:hypothetical protein